jgi:hypothetical protein
MNSRRFAWDEEPNGVCWRGWLPDLEDPLTRIGVIVVVRLAWGAHVDLFRQAHLHRSEVFNAVVPNDATRTVTVYEGPTEEAALLAALEAAP